MSTTHQIYHTHCTYGSSATDRTTGENAAIPKGYGLRAGSLTDRELADAGRLLDSWMAYRLPLGTPPGDNLKVPPEKAPRALVYASQVGPYEAIGQIVHRGTDSSGQRPGSYFAHAIFHDRGTEPTWGPLEALKLFAAPGWVIRDAATLPHRLPSLPGPGAILGRGVPAVDDRILLDFLTANPGDLVPKRWREKSAEHRVGLLLDLLSGYLAVLSTPRKVCLIAAEPGFAALLFYGVCRLLPPALLADMNFNTYDSEPTRRRFRLASTDLRDPKCDELPQEFIDSTTEYALNTYTGKRSRLKAENHYARLALRALANEGYPGLDDLIRRMHALGAKTGDDVNAAADALLLLPKVLDPAEDSVKPVWRQQPLAAKVLGDAVVARLAGPAGQALRQSLVGRPAQLRALEIVCGVGAAAAELRGQLLQSLPLDAIGSAVLLDTLPEAAKIERLAHYASQRGQLPPGSEAFWAKDANRADSPLARLVELIPTPVMARLAAAGIDAKTVPALLGRLFGASEQGKRDIARGYLTSHLNTIDDDGLCQFLKSPEGPALIGKLSPNNNPVGPRGQALLDDLPSQLDSRRGFDERLDAIGQIEGYLGDEYAARLDKWKSCRLLLSEVAKGPDSKFADPARDLGLAFRTAYGSIDTASPEVRVRALKRFMETQLGEREEIDPADWRTIRHCCDTGLPPRYSQRRRSKGGRSSRAGTPPWAIAAGVAGGLLVAGLLVVGIKMYLPRPTAREPEPPPVVVVEPPTAVEEFTPKPNRPVTPPPEPKSVPAPPAPRAPRTLVEVRASLDEFRPAVAEAQALVDRKRRWIAENTDEAGLAKRLEEMLEIAASKSSQPDFFLKLPILHADAAKFAPGDLTPAERKGGPDAEKGGGGPTKRRNLLLRLGSAREPESGRALGSGFARPEAVGGWEFLAMSKSEALAESTGAAIKPDAIGIADFDEPVVCSLALTASGSPPRTIELKVRGRLERDRANTLQAKPGSESAAAQALGAWLRASAAKADADRELVALETKLTAAIRRRRDGVALVIADIRRGEEMARAAVEAADPHGARMTFDERDPPSDESELRFQLHERSPFGPLAAPPAKSTVTWAIQFYQDNSEPAKTIDPHRPADRPIPFKKGDDLLRRRFDLHFSIAEPARGRRVAFRLIAPDRGWQSFTNLRTYTASVADAPVLPALTDWLAWLQLDADATPLAGEAGGRP